MDTEDIIHETQLIARNVRAMLTESRGMKAPVVSGDEIEKAVDRGVLQLDGTKNNTLALVVFVFPRKSKYTEHAPQMEPFLRRFFADHEKKHKRVPVMVIYFQIKHFVATILRKFRTKHTMEIHRDEIFLQKPVPELVPKHTIVHNKTALAERFGQKFETRLSRMYTGDKMAVWIGARAGDVVHVEYASGAGSQPQYLYVVPGDPMVSQRVHTVDADDPDADAEDDDLEPDDLEGDLEGDIEADLEDIESTGDADNNDNDDVTEDE